MAAAGSRTLILSTDPAHSLADSFEMELGSDPTGVADGLWAQQVQAQEEMERHWTQVSSWLGDLFIEQGMDRIAAEELTVPPGMDELFSLLQLKRAHASGDWDAIVVDCAPTGETLRLLSFPDVARWWLEKVFPWERQILSAARPIARAVFNVPAPSSEVFSEVQRLVQSLIEMNDILRDREHATVRLVMNPDRMVIGEAMRTFTYLNLYGYLTDAVVVNRVFPAEWRARTSAPGARSSRSTSRWSSRRFAPVPVLEAPYFDQEVTGAAMLDRLGEELFSAHEAGGVLHDRLTQELTVHDDGATLRLDLPFAQKGDVTLQKIGLELVVGVDGHKRTIMLPPALAPYSPRTATLEGARWR